jgi:hypothetical protein
MNTPHIYTFYHRLHIIHPGIGVQAGAGSQYETAALAHQEKTGCRAELDLMFKAFKRMTILPIFWKIRFKAKPLDNNRGGELAVAAQIPL